MPELHAIRQGPASQESQVPGHVAAQEPQPLAALCGSGQSSLQADARPFEMRAQRLARRKRPQNVGGPFADAVHRGIARGQLHPGAPPAPGLPRQMAGMLIGRPTLRMVKAYLSPLPISPMTFSTGMRTSLRRM